MKEVVIVAGANGSGKSTFAQELKAETNYPFLNADEIEKGLEIENAKFEAGRIFFKTLENWIHQEISFITESTLSGISLLQTIEKLKSKDYQIKIVYVFLETPQHCIDRIAIRVQKGGHHIPDEDVIRRFHRSKANFWEKYKNQADEWLIYFNGLQEVQRIALGSQEDYLVENEVLFEKFLTI